MHGGQPRSSGVVNLDRSSGRKAPLLVALGVVLVLGVWGAARLAPAHWDCPSWAPRATPRCAPPPARFLIEDYLTTTRGVAPVKYPEHADFLGLGDGTTPSEIMAAFPPGSTHSVGASRSGRHQESWTWRGVHYTATVVEATGRTSATYVYRDDDSPYYVSAPDNLLLGMTTIQDAAYWNGSINRMAPHPTRGWFAEFSSPLATNPSPTLYLAADRAGHPTTQPSVPPYPADSAPCLAVLYLETAASPAQIELGTVPSPRAGERLSCR